MESSEFYNTDLYFEAHITIEPIPQEKVSALKALCKRYEFRLADFILLHGDKEPKAFCTTRDRLWSTINKKVHEFKTTLGQEGYKVLRYKIENTLVDVRL